MAIMSGWSTYSNPRQAMFLVLLMLLLPVASQIQAVETLPEVEEPTHAPPILVEGLPPLMCGEQICDRPLRMYDRQGREAALEYGWWQAYGPDLDWNGMDDRLQRVLDGMESVSPTAILGPDGRKTVAIVVDYAWHPTEPEIDSLTKTLVEHGWITAENGAWFEVLESIDSIVVDKVPVSALMDIYHLDGVVVIEMQNVMAPVNNIASKAALARPSLEYGNTANELGYYGNGVVIAVMDTGVDNEHRSLNDFDDIDDEPDADASSYNDQKWVAGFDATSPNPNPDGATDPDDGNGHGTHVAGSALGTGDASRNHRGTAPGAALVDIKVLTDGGGTNSQASLAGIQWMINNKDTDWGINSTYKGIQIASMSYGSVGTPLNPGDQGDNGTSAEASLINQATEAGIICVVAIGNDGSNRVPSPGSADGAITVGSVDDNNTILRDDDVHSDFSNWGPRLSDGDDDEWDELKPDITSYGHNIISATYGTSLPIPGDAGLADDQYDSKSGTSMATPIASGVVALMLEADPSLTPQEVKDILRNSSEQRGEPYDESLSERWNEKYGFGIIDAACAVNSITGGACDNGFVVKESKSDVNVSYPANGTWLLSDTYSRISGEVNMTEIDYQRVELYIEQHFSNRGPKLLMDWTEANGTMENWYLDVEIKDEWVDYSSSEKFLLLHAKASDDEGNVSNIAFRKFKVSRESILIDTPIARNPLTGTVEVKGEVEGVEHDRIEYRIDDGDWVFGSSIQSNSNPGADGESSWSFDWDTTEIEDGYRELSVRMVNKSGKISQSASRSYTIDNVDPAPSLRFIGDLDVLNRGMPAENAYQGSLLEMNFEVYNAGDADATDIFVRLVAPGDESEVYPSQGLIPELPKGESVQVTLFWSATIAGLHEVKIELDPNNAQGDLDTSDNVHIFDYEILERPEQPVLRYLPGSVTTLPVVPLVDQDYSIKIRIDNLGKSEAFSLDLALEHWVPNAGWQLVDEERIGFVPGATIESGYTTVDFRHQASELGAVLYRATLTGDGVESEFSQNTFSVVISDVSSVAGSTTLSLSNGEYPVAFVGIESSTLVFTSIDEELHVRSLSDDLLLLTDTLVDDNWEGELDVYQREDGLIHAAWTSREQTEQGYFMTNIAMTSFSSTGQMLPIHKHLVPLKLSEGKYWGLDLAEDDGTLVLSGYYRNISTGGSWSDITSIFSLYSSNPDEGLSWSEPKIHIADVNIHPDDGDKLSTMLDDETLHILFQQERDDVTGIKRSGLMYTRGDLIASSWTYQSSIGDYASSAQLAIVRIDGDETIFASWIEGSGENAEVVTIATEGDWDEEFERVHAPGASILIYNPRGDMIEVVYNEITIRGEVARYGLLTVVDEQSVIGLGNIVSENDVLGYSMNSQDGILFLVSETGRFSMQKFLLDPEQEPEEPQSLLEQLLEPLPGSDEMKVRIFLGMVSILFIIFVLVVVSLRSSRKEDPSMDALVVEEDEIAILVQVEEDEEAEELVATVPVSAPVQIEMEEPTLADELEAKSIAGEGSARLNRRMKRKQEREIAEIVSKGLPPLPNPMPLPAIPDAEILPHLPIAELDPTALPPLADLPPLRRQANCPSCNANFPVTDLMRARVVCPICSEQFNL
ncbi:MAG: S8 family serine peptidase [Candidatus Poseidoniaceae archaeon]